MINIPSFEKSFVGRTFVDTGASSTQLTCIGYGDNGSNGAPYLVGMYNTSAGVKFKTVLLRTCEFVPVTTPTPATV